MNMEITMSLKDLALRLKPKRSPIFWGLIALVLISITPPMLMMLGASFQLFLSYLGDLTKGVSPALGDKDFWGAMLPIFVVGLVAMVCSVIVFSAMLCLVFKKYRAASKLLIAGPICFIVMIILVTQVSSLREGLPREGLINLTVVIHAMQRLLIFVVLFLYARKYLMMEKTLTAA